MAYEPMRAALVSELFGDQDEAPVARTDQEWESLLRIADWHRLSAVLARYVASDRLVPEPVAERLNACLLRDTARRAILVLGYAPLEPDAPAGADVDAAAQLVAELL